MESKTNEAHIFLSSVPGVPNPQGGSIFTSRHTPHSQIPVSHPPNYCVTGDNFTNSSIRPVIAKRKLSPPSHTANDRSMDGFSNGSPPKGVVLPSPAKRICPNNVQPEMRPVASAVHNIVPNQNPPAPLVNNIQSGQQSDILISSAEAVLVQQQQQPSLPPVVPEFGLSSADRIEQVIDDVLAKACSDEPHDDVFCLPQRTREFIPLPSPLNQESTPSSSLHTSPPLSPSCSPRLISPAFPNSINSSNNMVKTTQQFSRSGSVDHIQRPPNNTQSDVLQRERMRLQNSRSINMQLPSGKPPPQSAVAMLMKPPGTVDNVDTVSSFIQSTKAPIQSGYFEQPDINISVAPIQQPQQQQVCSVPPRQILSKVPLAVATEAKILPAQQQQSDMMQKQQQVQMQQQQQMMQQSHQNPNLQPRVFTYISQRQVCDPTSTNATVFTLQQQQQQQVRPTNISSNPPIAVKKDSMVEFTNQSSYPPPPPPPPPHGSIIPNGIFPSAIVRPQQQPPGIAPIHPMQYLDVSPKPTSSLAVIPPRKRPPAAKRKKSPVNNPALLSPGPKIATNVPMGYIRSPIVASQGLDFNQQQHQVQIVPPPPQQRVNSSQEAMNKLFYFDSKKFLSDPALEAFSSSLPPSGSPSVCPILPSGEESWINSCGVKYESSGFSLKALIPSGDDNDRISSRLEEAYLHQSLPNIVSHPTVRPPTIRSTRTPTDVSTRVCPSPEPLTLDNRMKSLWTNLRNADSVPAISKSSTDSASLLSMLKTPCSPRERPTECRSPHLQLYHIPNTCLLKAPRNSTSDAKENNPDVKTSSSDSVKPESRVIFSASTPINSSVDLVGLVRMLCVEIGINQNNMSIVGGEIVIRNPTGSEHSEQQIREFGNRLRSHFSTVSVRFESVLTPTPTAKTSESCEVSSQMKWLTELQKEKADDPNLQSSLGNKYKEESLSVFTVSNATRQAGEKCQICQKVVPLDSGIQIKWEELSASKSITLGSEQDYFAFCGESCSEVFGQFLNSHIPTTTSTNPQEPQQQVNTNAIPSENSNPVTAQSETRHPQQQLVTGGVSNSLILLQPMSHKSLKSQTCGRKISNLSVSSKRKVSPKQKRWRDTRWRIYRSDPYHVRKFAPVPVHASNDDSSVPRVLYQVVRDNEIIDSRCCILCSSRGDGTPNTTERLLCLGADRWVHLNCALWCFDIYESLSGSLHKVDECMNRALKTVCSHCGKTGAGLPCYNPRCNLVYHVPCAISVGCMFFNDRGMYCSSHQPKDHHSMRLSSLTVNRKVYVTRNENDQVADIVRSENSPCCIRVGSLTLYNVGQLLPHQIESEHFHTQKYIYPVFYSATRIFWSMRCPGRRSLYRCEIKEQDSRPLFQVTVTDKGFPDVVLQSFNCTELWREIAKKVQQLRRESGFIQNFPHLICGEEMFGLSEPNVLRAIESLPGVDNLIDYAFHFGRLQLIRNMPLAVNPSGCARSEPSFLTSMRRRRAYANSHEFSPKKAVYPHFRSPGRQMSGPPSISSSTSDPFNRIPIDLTTKNSTLVNWCQQYRKLKTECRSNVVFGRSRIQGFGMFAAQDLEPNTIVIEYIGELIRPVLADRREKEYEARNRGIYMFRLEADTVIDATMCGGPARYINHSCEPNCFAKYVHFDNEGHIVIITKRKVEKGEELTYDYLFDFEDQTSRIPCLCGAVNCRKWMN
ncbi:unnamed protein product [Hymenolepis diminuta]|uniref:Histone-lysine N-methyltransferase n=3 Tax=Hymenolepis diminuta TaxID=6216 RepID=A0A564YXT6_HYMDI|nr:unnamed protein product [Hymenolepis diminuta]